jgi:hypothetical protein
MSTIDASYATRFARSVPPERRCSRRYPAGWVQARVQSDNSISAQQATNRSDKSLKKFENFNQFAKLFYPSRSVQHINDWIDEWIDILLPPDRITFETIEEIDFILKEFSDEEVKQAWDSVRPVMTFPADETREFLAQTLVALKKAAGPPP